MESAALLHADGTATPGGTTFRGQSRRLRFAGTAGQYVGFALTGTSVLPVGAYLTAPVWYKPDGSALASLSNLPQDGGYSVVVKPDATATQSSFSAWLSTDLAATTSVGQPTSASVMRPGQASRYTFAANAGQRLRLHQSAATTSPAGLRVAVYLYAPDGNPLLVWPH